jgi:penicillin-binding protein 2
MTFGRDDKVPQFRLTIAQYVILAIFVFLGYGFWRLQVSSHEDYSKQAVENFTRKIPVLAPRGRILDREGRVIVDNYPSFSALLLRDQPRDIETDVDKIADGLHMEPKEVRDRLHRFGHTPAFQPIILKNDITPDELAFIESHKNELPELDTIMSHRRLYPKNGFLSHLVGYVGEVSEDMLNTEQFQFYDQGDIVGMSGVERQYNQLLMGKNGYRNAIVNAKGKEVGKLDETPAVAGKPLRLTIDLDVQVAAEEALEGKNGAIVAMDPRTGEVLAMASRPAFDPNAFAVRISSKDWNALINDPAKPLLNKAIQAQLAPGSTFKILMSVAGVQEGIAQNMNVHCNGGATFYGHRFGCWVKGGHGSVDLTKAIYQSCDVFFYTLAERLGIGRIAKYATMFGLGQKTGIDLPNEVSGVMPSEEWKMKNYRQKWYAGETISVGIGQGAVATTPVQMMRMIGAISTGGRMVVPHVANPSDLPPNYVQVNNRIAEVKQIDINPDGWNTITAAMSRVLLPEGTAPSAHIAGVEIAGKTGSAQTVSLATRAKHANNEEFAQNGWFVGFTPRKNPEIIIACLFEGGEHGKLAARVATQVLKAYVEKKRKVQPDFAKEIPPERHPQPKTAEASAPADTADARHSHVKANSNTVEVAGFLNGPPERGENQETMQGVRFNIAVDNKKRAPLKSAPGIAQ